MSLFMISIPVPCIIEAPRIYFHPIMNFFTSSKNISEFAAVASKYGVSHNHITKYISDILKNTIVLYPDPASIVKFLELIFKYKPQGNKVHDIEIVTIMISNGISSIATFNIKDFSGIEGIEIL